MAQLSGGSRRRSGTKIGHKGVIGRVASGSRALVAKLIVSVAVQKPDPAARGVVANSAWKSARKAVLLSNSTSAQEERRFLRKAAIRVLLEGGPAFAMSLEEAAKRLVDFSQPFDVALLDQVSRNQETETAASRTRGRRTEEGAIPTAPERVQHYTIWLR
eukprot:scaffold48_cov311-Pinguiococcus_pyrenoidosus.AAC.307